MLVLFETPAGYALFKMKDESKLDDPDNIFTHFATPEQAAKTLKLKAFSKFENTTDAMSAVTALVEGKLSKGLKKFLSAELSELDLKEKLAVGDSKLAASIAKKMEINVVSDSTTLEVMRGIRSQITTLISGLPESDMNAMILGLSHSLSRYKLKFSPDKVDTMIIQAIHLLDDLDKELNTYAMRAKEWYGWHFPEMTKIIVDNLAYAKVIKAMGFRSNAASVDLSSVLPEELEKEVKDAAEISMGTEISDEDIDNINHLADQIISITEYRAQLYDYLKNRMAAIAPNLTCLVGELVGARLIAHAGSLLNLSKQPASTIQILGAEKALFRALKSKHDTPKYGLIYHASLVGQAGPKIKGKVARTVATKCALSVRVDALGETEGPTVGIELRAKVEARLRQLEGKAKTAAGSATKNKKEGQKKFEFKQTKSFNASTDVVMSESTPKKRKAEDSDAEEAEAAAPTPSRSKKTVAKGDEETEKKDDGEKKKKKKKKAAEDNVTELAVVGTPTTPANGSEEKPKKKKKKSKTADDE
ncbi:Nucleolar protein 58 [Physocladia obscura]|uniref:Nucleolar protein 58 n=1 Tax=Physocladia obscura TaxID=109957 RepID=A0AAD5STL4_9FUNG|nr:Nucleolar protein 58 [Physocladia obscura]